MDILKLGSQGANVSQWEQMLIWEGYPIVNGGLFDNSTLNATLDFQRKHGLVVDGKVGPITWNFMLSLYYPAPNLLKSNNDVLIWIKRNLGTFINTGLQGHKFTEDWLASIACRETGGLIVKYVNRGTSLTDMLPLIEGDFTTGHYHGFSFWQIDIRSFPDFINSGDWKDVQKSATKATDILQGKANYLATQNLLTTYNFTQDQVDRDITAAYNCGEGNVMKAVKNNFSVDAYTANQDYSSQVFQFREIYKTLT
jgi:hypothetical protein